MKSFTKLKSRKLPKSSFPVILKLLKSEKKTLTELCDEINMPYKTIKYVIRRLTEEGFVEKIPNIFDMRSKFFVINPERRELLEFMVKHHSLQCN